MYNVKTKTGSHFGIVFSFVSPHYENTPIQIYRKISRPKSEIVQIKNSDSFIFLFKTYIVVIVRTASAMRFSNENPQSMFLSRNKH